MTARTATGDRIPTREPIVCLDADYNTMPRLSESAAATLVSHGWAVWRGKGTRLHVQLTADAPLARNGSCGGSHTTQRIRDRAGVAIGAPRSGLEHKPILSF
jgi:hypothetical protein